VIRVRSAVDEKLKKIKDAQKEREDEEERKQRIPVYILSFLLFEECVPYNTVYVCVALLSLFCVRTITHSVLFLSFITTKEKL
jgi:hypothetical protein